jgi:glyoxylase-like metal-dependent hydrolase (beta-lactamase superfamily II)
MLSTRMFVHHLNCASMCPVSARLVNGSGSLLGRGTMVCHCLLVETNDGLLLVDTGLGSSDLAAPRRQLGRPFLFALSPQLDPEEMAVRRIEKLGFKPDDVRHIVVTHLDLDHAGGLVDFPRAKVHVYAPEHAAAMARSTHLEQQRYLPAHWAHSPSWVLHRSQGERWFGFESVRELVPRTPDVLLVPLVGHTRGHSAVALRDEAGWLLHAGDAYFFRGEVASKPSCPAGLRIFQRLVAADDAARVDNQARLRELVATHGHEVRVFCAHDPVELEEAQKRSPRNARVESAA